jgi:hypothetical protein
MSAATRRNRTATPSALVLACAFFAFFPQVNAQDAPQVQSGKLPHALDRANVADAIARVKSGQFSGVQVDLIARAQAVKAIPALKEQFTKVQDPLLKEKVAAALVRLGDQDESYWDYLLKEAKIALDSQAPSIMTYDSDGKAAGSPSPEFEAWRRTENRSQDINAAAEDANYLFPARVLNLGWSHDRRAIPYLRQGLSSPNYLIEVAAANGLAELDDENSIPLIISACQKAPKEVAAVMAEALAYFNNDVAQKAVDQYVSADLAKAMRDGIASGQQTKPMSVPLYDSAPSHP